MLFWIFANLFHIDFWTNIAWVLCWMGPVGQKFWVIVPRSSLWMLASRQIIWLRSNSLTPNLCPYLPDLKEFTITNYPKAWQPNHWRSNYPRPDLCSSCMSLPPKKKCPKQSIGPKSQDPQDKKMHPEMMREKNVRFPCFQFAPWSGCTQSQTLTEEVLSTDSTGIEYDIQGLLLPGLFGTILAKTLKTQHCI